jgi:hypothetical protein
MDIYKEWQSIQKEKFDSITIKKEEIMNTIYQDSNSTIGLLKTRLKHKRNWIVFFLIAFTVWGALSLDKPEILYIIIGLFFTYAYGFIMLTRSINNMSSSIDYSDQTLPMMKKNYELITGALNSENLMGFAIFPIAILVGLILPGLYRGQTIMDMIDNSRFLQYALLVMVVAMPIMFVITKKMNNYAYGKLIEQLKKNIHQMELLQ